MLQFLIDFDIKLFKLLNNNIANPLFDKIFPIITKPESWLIALIPVIVYWVYKEKKRALIIIVLSLLLAAITDSFCVRILKPLFGRLRPCNPNVLIESGRFLLGNKTSFSFPSAHAFNSFGLAALYSRLYPNNSKIFYSAAVLIGFSRIYTGVHYPLDVIAGAIGGISTAYIFLFVYRMILSRITGKK